MSDSKALSAMIEQQNQNLIQMKNIKVFKLLTSSPQQIFITVLTLIFVSIIIYISIEFFSNNRFRGISPKIFTKRIGVTGYIKKFNDTLYNDFNNIKEYYTYYYTYYEYKDKDKEEEEEEECKKVKYSQIFFTHCTMKKIHDFMNKLDENNAKEDFENKIHIFFRPNPTFTSNDKQEKLHQEEFEQLKHIFENLYQNDFHESYSHWMNYGSIWNFVYKNNNTGTLNDNLLTLESGSVQKDLIESIKSINEKIKGIKDGSISKNMKDDMKKFMNAIKVQVASKATDKLFANMIREWEDEMKSIDAKIKKLDEKQDKTEKDKSDIKKLGEEKKKIDSKINTLKYNEKLRKNIKQDMKTLFFSNSAINYSSISQQLTNTCSLLDDVFKDQLLNEFKEMSLTQDKLKKIVESTSFFNVLDRLYENNYIVSKNLLKEL